MKKLAIAAVALSLSSGAFAAQYGVGVVLDTFGGDEYYSGSTIYIPINVSKELRVEPFVSFSTREYDENGGSNYKQDIESLELGVGVYKLIPASSNTNIIIGGRVSYEDSSYEYTCDTCVPYEEDADGYTIAPVLGFEYFPIPNFSVGADVAIEYRDSNGDRDDTKSTDTETQINVKYYFN